MNGNKKAYETEINKIISEIKDGNMVESLSLMLDEPTSNAKEEQEQDKRFHSLLSEGTENRLLILLMKSASEIFADMIDSIRGAEMMQLKTVAEGIETKQQVERIRSMGGDYIQGYFYSNPFPRMDFESYIQQNS